MPQHSQAAVACLKAGGVIAYPTEHCFGLGCDPQCQSAIQRILEIKQRSAAQGVILIAATVEQIEKYADLKKSPLRSEILASWPGPVTWLLPTRGNVSAWITGKHPMVGMRLTGHPQAKLICSQFGGAIVSTSANRHGRPALMSAAAVASEMGSEIDCIVDAPLGGADRPSLIRDSITGKQIR